MKKGSDRSVRYHHEFHQDVLSDAQWYDKRSTDLGGRFVEMVQDACNALIADPERRNAAEYGIRYWPVQHFPHVVFYDFADEEIQIVGVMHTSRQPDDWLARRK